MSTDEILPESDCITGTPHPRTTSSLFGQIHAEQQFLDAVNKDRLHHAWLITGPKGVGKATLAWHITRYMLEKSNASSSSDMFSSPQNTGFKTSSDSALFNRIAALSEPSVYLCRRPWDEKAKRLKSAITVDEVRNLKSFFNLSATDGGWRIAIVDCAEEMNRSAENALLKILEEPPEKTLILLVCHQPSKLLPTTRSRCRELRCNKLDPDALTAAVTNAGITLEESGAVLFELAAGSAGEAIDLITNDGVNIYLDILNILNTAPRMNREAILKLADTCAGKGNEEKYASVVRLTILALSRLCINGTKQKSSVIDLENEISSRLCNNRYQAKLWADTIQYLSQRIEHARTVNMDPTQVVLDTFLELDKTANKVATH